MQRSSSLVALALLAVSLGPSHARAQTEAARGLSQFQEMVLHARYDEAIAALGGFLERTDLSARERNAALELMAVAQLANRNRDAQQTLRILYARDPDHRLSDPGASPTVQAAFQRANEARPEAVQPEIRHTPPELHQRRAPIVEVTLGERADAVQELRVAYRTRGEATYAGVVMQMDGGTGRVRLPLAEGDEAYTLEYYLEAHAPSGAVLGRAGSASEPLTIAVPEPTAAPAGVVGGALLEGGDGGAGPRDEESAGVLGQWWFWTIVGAVVVGGVATYLALTSMPGDAPDGTLGTSRLGLRF